MAMSRPIRLLGLFVLAAAVASGQCIAAPPRTTPPYEFVEVFVDQLVSAHQIETQAAQDVAVARTPPDGTQLVLMSAIRSCTRMRLELAVIAGRMLRVSLANPDLAPLPVGLADMYANKASLCDDIVRTAKTLIEDPRPGIDYGKLAAHMPEVSAQLDFINKSLFKATPIVALSMVSKEPDSKNQLSQLVITRQQGDRLIQRLQREFGDALDAKEQNWTTSSASVLCTFLREKGYRFANLQDRK